MQPTGSGTQRPVAVKLVLIAGSGRFLSEGRQATVTLEQGEQMPEWTDRKMEGESEKEARNSMCCGR